MELVVKKSFYKDLRKCPKHIILAAVNVLDCLKIAENMKESGVDYSIMEGWKKEKYYRIRVGDWRIGIKLLHPKIIVMSVVRRGDFYKKFPPK